jgi:hypothetical protein
MICEPPTNRMGRHSNARIIRSSKVTSDASRVPPEFRSLLPLARALAVGDDSERCALLTSRPLHSRRAMVSAVFPHFETLEAWIANEKRRSPMCREAKDLELLLEAATEAVFDIYLV